MIQHERFETILYKLKHEPSVSVVELSQEMGVSESTIRRDIVLLDREGRLRRVFGGAIPAEEAVYSSPKVDLYDMQQKASMNIEAKKKIGRYAASLIEENDFVFLDAGTTTGAMIPFLENRSVTYVTNACRHALALAAKGLTTYMIEGHMKAFTEALVGPAAVSGLQKYNFTKIFIGVDAIDVERELTTSDIEEAMVKTAAIRCAREAYVLADHSKFDLVAAVHFAGLQDVTILTDGPVPVQYTEKAKVKGVEA